MKGKRQPQSDKLEVIYILSPNVNEKNIKYIKNFEFSTLKNSINMLNSPEEKGLRTWKEKMKMKIEYKVNHKNLRKSQIVYSIYEKTILIKLLWLISI